MRDKYFKDKNTAILISLFCMFLWGSAFPMIKIGYQELGIVQEDIFGKIYFAGCRFFIAGLLVCLYYFILEKERLHYTKGAWKLILALAFLQTAGQYFFFYIGVGNTTGVKSSVLQASSTFFTVILAHFMLKGDRLTWQKTLALILGFSGIMVTNFGNTFDWHFTMLGEGFMLISAILSSFANIFVKEYGQKINSFLLAAGQFFIGGSTLFIIGRTGLGHNLHFTPLAFALLLYGSFISATAFVLWYIILKYHPVGEISIYRLFIPAFGTVLSALIIPGESFTYGIFIGLFLVVIGMVVLNWHGRKQNNCIKN